MKYAGAHESEFAALGWQAAQPPEPAPGPAVGRLVVLDKVPAFGFGMAIREDSVVERSNEGAVALSLSK
jgi:hypothetical protein